MLGLCLALAGAIQALAQAVGGFWHGAGCPATVQTKTLGLLGPGEPKARAALAAWPSVSVPSPSLMRRLPYPSLEPGLTSPKTKV